MTENEQIFRMDEERRKWLQAVLVHPYWIEAVSILRERRNDNESKMEGLNMGVDGWFSTRLNSQRIGMEGVFIDLPQLTFPPAPPKQDVPDDYNEPEAYQKVHDQ